jgi:chaperone required for assembly of F1-ATPase
MKRFYRDVSVGEADGVFRILLDGKTLKTPAKGSLNLPSRALAEAIADEWGSAGEAIDPHAMPQTRLAFTALDGVSSTRDKVVEYVLGFGRSDLLCYRAEAPQELVARQEAEWNPLLDWAAERYGARHTAVSGITYVEQPAEALRALERAIESHDDFALTALHTAASITGSLVLALALSDGLLDAAQTFSAATVDETFQAEQWGHDAEADARLTRLSAELAAAGQFLRLLA